MSAANSKARWLLVWVVLWAGGCADDGLREAERPAQPEPAGRRELIILTPTDSVAVPAEISDASDEPDDPSPVFFDPDGQFTVQVGVYRDAQRADLKVRELKDEGYPAYSIQSDAGVRVRIGYFTERADADRFGRIFAKDRGVEYWIARRTHE